MARTVNMAYPYSRFLDMAPLAQILPAPYLFGWVRVDLSLTSIFFHLFYYDYCFFSGVSFIDHVIEVKKIFFF